MKEIYLFLSKVEIRLDLCLVVLGVRSVRGSAFSGNFGVNRRVELAAISF